MTNGGVASTVRDAHVREFGCTVIEDGCAAFSDDVHRAAIEGLRPVAKILTIADMLRVAGGEMIREVWMTLRIPRLATFALLIATLLPGSSLTTRADDYPSKPIKLLGRRLAGRHHRHHGAGDRAAAVGFARQPVLVENRPGAGGNLAADAVAKSAPDGYTLLVSFTSHTINATLYPKLPFDPVADFTPISMISTVPSLLVGNPKLPAQNLKELIAVAKAKPDTLTIAIGGIGSSLHLAGDQFKMMADVRILNVPYKGTAPALTDVLGGQVDMMFISLVTGTAQVRAGKLRAYGVTTAQRQPSFPDLPAIGEVVKGFRIDRLVRRVRPGEIAGQHHRQTQCRHCGSAEGSEDARHNSRTRARLQRRAAPPILQPSCATTSSAGRRSSSNRVRGLIRSPVGTDYLPRRTTDRTQCYRRKISCWRALKPEKSLGIAPQNFLLFVF